MLNPWLSLSLQAVRLGWETQTVVLDQLMRIAGASALDRKAVSAFDAKEIAAPAEDRAAEAPTPPIYAGAPAKSSNHRQIAQKALNTHKEQGLGSKRRGSK
jgi:hypothetical protein